MAAEVLVRVKGGKEREREGRRGRRLLAGVARRCAHTRSSGSRVKRSSRSDDGSRRGGSGGSINAK